MEQKKAKETAAKILKTGKDKVWLDSTRAEKIKEALTKDDVRALIKEKTIKKKKPPHQSKARARKLKEKKKKGRKRGHGKRGGTKKAREKRKKQWIKKVRAQRKALKELKKKTKLRKGEYSKIYRRIKGGYFKGKKYVAAGAEKTKKVKKRG